MQVNDTETFYHSVVVRVLYFPVICWRSSIKDLRGVLLHCFAKLLPYLSFCFSYLLELLLLSACHRRSKGQSLFRFTFHPTVAAPVASADVWNIWYFLLFSLIVYSHPAVRVLLEKISLTEVSDRCSRRTLKICMSTHNLGVLLSSTLRDTRMLEHGIRYRKPVKEVR